MTKILALPLEIQQEDQIIGLSHFGKEKKKATEALKVVIECAYSVAAASALSLVCVLGGGSGESGCEPTAVISVTHRG